MLRLELRKMGLVVCSWFFGVLRVFVKELVDIYNIRVESFLRDGYLIFLRNEG